MQRKSETEKQREEEQRIAADRESMLRRQHPLTREPLHQPAPVVRETVYADDEAVLHSMLQAYKARFNKETWYEEPKKDANGNYSFSFKDEETATAFAEEQAKAGHKFIMVDAKTGEVKGYSDGTTFHKNEDNKSMEEIKNLLAGQLNSDRPAI